MPNRLIPFRSLVLLPLTFAVSGLCCGQSFIAEIKAEHDPSKRAQKALEFADQAFETARDYYNKGLVKKGDEHLDYMTTALRECVGALDESHKARYYKKAEMNVADLERRLNDLVNGISVEERGWAEQMTRNVDELHDKLIEGVMRK